MQLQILSGITTDLSSDFRTSYPRNMVPVPKDTGISKGYLHSAEGITQYPLSVNFVPPITDVVGPDRGGINWNGVHYRVIGQALCRVNTTGILDVLVVIPGTGQVTMDYSFDLLGIAANGSLYYWSGSALTQVTDADLGIVIDMMWLGGYWIFTDGEFVGVTDLSDPYSVNPLKYGSSEVDPDPIVSLLKLRNEAYALNRYTTQVFENVGGSGFPFALIPGALITRGAIGTFTADIMSGNLAFLGSGRNEQPSVYVAGNGETRKIATREIEVLLKSYTEDELSLAVCETREHDGHVHFYMHLPTITAVYDASASAALDVPVWFYLSSSTTADGAFKFRNFVYVNDQWFCGGTGPNYQVGVFDESTTKQPGAFVVGWQFDTQLIFNETRGFILHEIELSVVAGRTSTSSTENQTDYQVGIQYTKDGVTWSDKKFKLLTRAGKLTQRLQWRPALSVTDQTWLGLRFSGTQPISVSFARLDAKVEALG